MKKKEWWYKIGNTETKEMYRGLPEKQNVLYDGDDHAIIPSRKSPSRCNAGPVQMWSKSYGVVSQTVYMNFD